MDWIDGGLPSLRPVNDMALASDVLHRQVDAALDLDDLFANMPKWQIEYEVLAPPSGPSCGGTLRLSEIGLASNRLGCTVRTKGTTPSGQLAIGLDIASPPGRQFGGRSLTADDALIGYCGAELDYLHPAGFHDLSFILPGTLVETALQQRVAAPVALSRFRSPRVADAGRHSRPDLWRLFGWLSRALHGEAAWPRGAGALDLLHAEVLDAVGTLVGRYLEGPVELDQPTWHHRRPVALRATEFMRAQLGEPITLGDICTAARASERTVEYAFRDLYGVGAKRYLKILRLNQVRRRLRRHDPGGVSIQEVAAESGFWHMGHFSADYRRFFGESPSETARRAGRGGR